MPKLEADSLVKEFPAVRALDGVSITFEPGEVHGIIGENGAGKSTLMNILSGVFPPTSGQILLDGAPVALCSVRDSMRRGIAMIHQELNLVDELTVAENVFLGREPCHFGVLDRAEMVAKTNQVLADVHAKFPADRIVGELSIAGKQLVEIAKAVSLQASILIMDEPTAVLSDPETESLFALIASLKQRGTTVLYISHRLTEVSRICDRITVLRDGVKVTTLSAEGSTPAMLADLMVGRPLQDFYPPQSTPKPAAPVIEARLPGSIPLAICPGEIVGLAGLVGAGRTELCEAIVGQRALHGLEVFLQGEPARVSSVRDALRRGIAYVSEDRKGTGLHMNLDVIENVTLANLRAFGAIKLDAKRQRERAEAWRRDLDIRLGDLSDSVASLSGGNQQKISIAKWLETQPRVLILDEPTRGVDVGAKREIYCLIQRLAQEGLACLVVSSELPEIIGLCHRTVVMREGTIVGEVRQDELNEEAIMRLAAGVEAA